MEKTTTRRRLQLQATVWGKKMRRRRRPQPATRARTGEMTRTTAGRPPDQDGESRRRGRRRR
jgi:hypothetical protein